MFDLPFIKTTPDLKEVFELYNQPSASPCNGNRAITLYVDGRFVNKGYKVSVTKGGQLSIKEISIKNFLFEIETQDEPIDAGSLGDDNSMKFTLYKVLFFDLRLTPHNRAIELAAMPIAKAKAYVARLPISELVKTFIEMFKLAGNTVSQSGELQISNDVEIDRERRALEDTLDKIDAEFLCYQKLKEELINEADAQAESQLAQCTTELAEALPDEGEPSDENKPELTSSLNQLPDTQNKAKGDVAYLLMLSKDERTSERLSRYGVHSGLSEQQAADMLTSVQQKLKVLKSQKKDIVGKLKKLRIPAKGVEFNGRLLLEFLWYDHIESYEGILKLILKTPDYLPYLDFFCGSKYMVSSLTNALVKANISREVIVNLLISKSEDFQRQAIESLALSNKGICRIVDLIDYLGIIPSDRRTTEKLNELISVIGKWVEAAQKCDGTRTFMRKSSVSEELSEPNEQISLAAQREGNEQIMVPLKARFTVAAGSSSTPESTERTIEDEFEWVLDTPLQKVIYHISPAGYKLLEPYLPLKK